MSVELVPVYRMHQPSFVSPCILGDPCGGGIVEFYRQQATGEIRESSEIRKPTRHSSGSPMIIEDSVLARNVIGAVAQGSQIQCNEKQYPEIRDALNRAAQRWNETGDEACLMLALNEIQRLDLAFDWKQPQ